MTNEQRKEYSELTTGLCEQGTIKIWPTWNLIYAIKVIRDEARRKTATG